VAQFFNEELPYKKDFRAAFKEYCKQNNYPIEIENEESLFNSIKAFIAIQIFGENLYTRIVNQEDPFILRALTEIDKK
jgi:hypothetical protein